MDEQKIKRINELYRKSKAEGLTESRKKRNRKSCARNMWILSGRNLRSQLDRIDIEEKDGTVVNLGEKFGNKKGN